MEPSVSMVIWEKSNIKTVDTKVKKSFSLPKLCDTVSRTVSREPILYPESDN